MPFMRRSSNRPNSSRGCNKVRLTNKHEVAEIESWVDIMSQNESDDEQIRFQSLRMKEESKESVYAECERIKKRYAKSLYKQTFEEQMLIEFRKFYNGVMSRLEEQNKILTQLVSMQKSTHTYFSSCAKYQY